MSKHGKIRPLHGSQSRGAVPFPVPWPRLSSWTKGVTTGNWGIPLTHVRVFVVSTHAQTPEAPSRFRQSLWQSPTQPFVVTTGKSNLRWRGPETAWKFPHMPGEFRHRTKSSPCPKWNSRERFGSEGALGWGLGGHGGDLCGIRAPQGDVQVSQCQHGLMSAPTYVNAPSVPRSTNTPGHDPTR